MSIEAIFALNRAKRVFQSKEVQCSLRREKTRGVRVDQERGHGRSGFKINVSILACLKLMCPLDHYITAVICSMQLQEFI